MAKRKKRSGKRGKTPQPSQADTRPQPAQSPQPPSIEPDPPRRNLPLLIAAIALMAGWVVCLLLMAFGVVS